VRGAVK